MYPTELPQTVSTSHLNKVRELRMAAPIVMESRDDVYANKYSRKILEHLVRNEQTIGPTILQNDEIQYELVDKILGEKRDSQTLLAGMSTVEVLVAELIDQVPACAECASKQLSTRYLCPKCDSYDINRTHLYEHLKCGKVGSDESFKKGVEIVCPKCQAVLHDFGVEYRAVGVWYKCNKCQNSFDSPVHRHRCRPNQHEFSVDRINLIPVYQYTLNRNLLNEIKSKILFYSDAVEMLEKLGITLHAPHNVPTKSNQMESFDIVIVQPKKGWKGEKTLAIDVYADKEKAGIEVVKKFAAKIRDTCANDSCLIAVPGLSDDASILAKKLKLKHIQGTTLLEATQALQSESSLKEYTAVQ